jgi:hypothetical protein
VQAGWDGLIVEPFPPLMERAKQHTQRCVGVDRSVVVLILRLRMRCYVQ